MFAEVIFLSLKKKKEILNHIKAERFEASGLFVCLFERLANSRKKRKESFVARARHGANL